ncbi:MAG TPA: hypothetical protein PKA53_11305 [Sphingobacterium sp.]|nr:hypothetical protein [Sphingobacterium sp.]
MSVIMRIIQQFDPCHEESFMALEKQFEALEKSRPDLPKGKRMQPFSGREPVNSLIWQAEFADIESAHKALELFKEDETHESLFVLQAPFIKQVRIEFYKGLDFSSTF